MSSLRTAAGDTVVIRRDVWGMPSIEADDEAAAWFGVGYAQAEDHLHELLAQYLLVRGELSRLFGPTTLPHDLHQRRWQVLEHAREDLKQLPDDLRLRHEAFIAGVQRYVADHPTELPPWAPPLEAALPLGRTRTLVWPWAAGDAMAALDTAGVASSVFDPGASATDVERGSNAWALDATRTADGSAVLLSDPHLPVGSLLDGDGSPRPTAALTGSLFTMFEFALAAGGLEFVGFGPVGTVLPPLATTSTVAWALTTGQPNCSDAYRIEVSPSDPSLYFVDGTEHTIHSQEIEIPVAGRSEPQRDTIEWVELNGCFAPIVARDEAAAYAVCTPYVEDGWRMEVQLDAMLRAEDVDEFLDTFELLGLFPQNVVVADRGGRIGYIRAGRVPVRPTGVETGTVLDGNTKATRWLGLHPASDLLRIVDPPGGFLQVCNTAPDTATGSVGAIDPPDRAPYLFNDEPGRTNSRGARISQLLATADDPVDEAAVTAAAVDTYWMDTPTYLKAMRRAAGVPASVDDPDAERFWTGLLDFDGYADADSRGALWWQYWREALLAEEEHDAERLCDRVEAGDVTPAVESWFGRAVGRAVERLRREVGSLDRDYGDVFRVGPVDASAPGAGGAFVRRPLADGETRPQMMAPLRVIKHTAVADGDGHRHSLFGGPSLRLSHLRADRVHTQGALLYGQRTDSRSRHYGDQAPLLHQKKLRSLEPNPQTWNSDTHKEQTLQVDRYQPPTSSERPGSDSNDTDDPASYRSSRREVGAFRFGEDGVVLTDDGRVDGVPVDSDIQTYLNLLPPPSDKRPPSGRWAVKLARKNGRRTAQMLAPPPEPVAEVVDRSIEGSQGPIPVRVYRPASDERLPVIVFAHGGAFVGGDLDGSDSLCRLLATRVEAVVVSVDYRLAPEHPFPAGVRDLYDAASWVQRNATSLGGDPDRVCIFGESAGATLAAATTLLARDRGEPAFCYQVLVNPATDHAFQTESAEEFRVGYLLTVPFMEVAWEHYVPDPEQRNDPLASPLRCSDLSDLPPGLVLTAGYDPLRDEGEAYGDRLRAAGSDVHVRRYPGAVHGWFIVPHMLVASKQAWDEVTAVLRYRLHGELPGDATIDRDGRDDDHDTQETTK